MAKRDTGTRRSAGGATTANAMQQRIIAFAEQLGRMAGTIQARTDGWMHRDALKDQIASVRDGAAHLLEHLAGGATKARKKKPVAGAARGGNKGRGRGAVDAPGKKRRKRAPIDPEASIADSQAAKLRAAKTMEKTHRRRGRG